MHIVFEYANENSCSSHYEPSRCDESDLKALWQARNEENYCNQNQDNSPANQVHCPSGRSFGLDCRGPCHSGEGDSYERCRQDKYEDEIRETVTNDEQHRCDNRYDAYDGVYGSNPAWKSILFHECNISSTPTYLL